MAKQIANSTGAFGQEAAAEAAQQPGTYDAEVHSGSAAIVPGDSVDFVADATAKSGGAVPVVTLGAGGTLAGAANSSGTAGSTISVVNNGATLGRSTGLTAGTAVGSAASGNFAAGSGGEALAATADGKTLIWLNV